MAAGARESLNTSLYSPAARQMIVHHLLANSSTPAGAPGFRDRFMLALRDNGEPGSLGYPVHLRRIALADGRLDGQPDPGGQFCGGMFEMDASFRKGNAFLLGVGNLLFSPFNQYPINIAQCTARYAPAANTSCVVFEGKLNYESFSIQVPGGGTYSTSYSQVTVDSGPLTWRVTVGGQSGTQAAIQLIPPASYGPNVVRYRPLRSGPMTVTAEGLSICDSTIEVSGTNPNLLIIPGQYRSTVLPAYPNPASTQLTVPLAADQAPAQAMLYSSQGLLVRQQTAAAGAATMLLDTATLPAGLYNLMVRQGERFDRQHLEIKHQIIQNSAAVGAGRALAYRTSARPAPTAAFISLI